MKLARFAILQLGGDPGPWRRFSGQREGLAVCRLHDWKQTGSVYRQLLVAETALATLPEREASGRVRTPDAERRAAEHALEQTADAISVATGHARALRSPALAAALCAESDEERAWLAECSALDRFDRTVSVPRFTVILREANLEAVADRADGLQILAEALAQEHPAGCFRELLRVFERAFRRRGRGLVPRLSEFLEQRPGLGFSKKEVENWIVGMRGQTAHASDKETFYVAADLRPLVARMKLAA